MANEQQPNNMSPQAPANPEGSWQFHAEEQPGPANSQPIPTSSAESVSWTASEFIAHHKSGGWYGLLMLASFVIAGIVYLFTRGDLVSTLVVIIVAIVFAIFAARKPRVLEYRVDNNGIKIGEKFYPYNSFRSFAVIQEDAIDAIWLMPLKRFMPIISVYFEPNDGQKIMNTLSTHLPVEHHQPDPVDRLMSRIRF